MTSRSVAQRFDGSGWVDIEASPADDGILSVMPALVDAHARRAGWREHPMAGDALTPAQLAEQMMTSAGVGAVRDMGNHLTTLAGLAAAGPATGATRPVAVASGPVIDAGTPRYDTTWPVTGIEGARTAIEVLHAARMGWIELGPHLGNDLVAEATRIAHDFGMKVALRPGLTTVADAVGAGVDSLEHLGAFGPHAAGLVPVDAICGWGDVSSAWIDDHVALLASSDSPFIVPLLVAWRRSSLLDEVVAEPRLSDLVAIAPFHSYLAQMSGAAGMAFGKRYAKRFLAMTVLKGDDRRRFDAGWDALTSMLVALVESGARLAAGSDAVGLSLAPGHALVTELIAWERAGVTTDAALAAAVDPTIVGLPAGAAGVIASTRRAADGIGALLAQPTWLRPATNATPTHERTNETNGENVELTLAHL